jgi:hypothetical protein
MVAIKNILLFVAAAAAMNIGKRDVVGSTLVDISDLSQDFKSLDSAVNAYEENGLAGFSKIEEQCLDLQQTLQTAAFDADDLTDLSTTEQQYILRHLQDLKNSVKTTLGDLKDHAALFKAQHLEDAVAGLLGQVDTQFGLFSDELLDHLDGDELTQARAVSMQIRKIFQDTIAVFSPDS